MSDNMQTKLYSDIKDSPDSIIEVKPRGAKKSTGYESNISEFNTIVESYKPQLINISGSRPVSSSDISGIIEDANVVSGIKDIFAVGALAEFSPTEIDLMKASPKQVSKLRQLVKKLPDDSSKKLQKLLEEMDTQ